VHDLAVHSDKVGLIIGAYFADGVDGDAGTLSKPRILGEIGEVLAGDESKKAPPQLDREGLGRGRQESVAD